MATTKRIYKREMAEFLVEFGCTLVKVVPDIVKPNFYNWLFINDDKLNQGMTLYTQTLKTGR